jgi:hypothetical protein
MNGIQVTTICRALSGPALLSQTAKHADFQSDPVGLTAR